MSRRSQVTTFPHATIIDVVQPELAAFTMQGMRWYPSRPPVLGLDFEWDVRGIGQESIVAIDDA